MNRSYLEKYLYGVGLVFLVWCVYGRVTYFSFVDLDDQTYLLDNPTVRGGLTLDNIWWTWTHSYFSNWHPLTTLSWMLDVELFGLSPQAMHLVNVLWHTGNVILVFLLFLRLTGAIGNSACVAALFAIHPLHVESVAWISSRKDVLFLFFGLLSLNFYVTFSRQRQRKWLILSLVTFSASLLCKQMLVTLPFLLLLLDFYPLQRLNLSTSSTRKLSDESLSSQLQQVSLARAFLEKIPYFILTFVFSSLIYMIQKRHGSVAESAVFTLNQRIVRSFVSYTEYIQHLFWPSNLSVFYPFGESTLTFNVVAGAVCLVGMTTLLTVWQAYKRPYLLVGWLWFLGTFLPVIGLIQIGWQRIADRYTYFPVIGLYFALVWLLSDLLESRKKLKLCLSALIIMMLSIVSWRQVSVWKNGITLFEHGVRCHSDDSKIRTAFGWALFKRGEIALSRQQLEMGVEISPDSPEAHSNLADFYHKTQEDRRAIEHHQAAVALGEDILKIQHDAGSFYQDVQLYEQAIHHYQLAVDLSGKPELIAKSHNGLGIIYFEKGDLSAAESEFRKALHVNASREVTSEVLTNQGILMSAQGKFESAQAIFSQAVSLDPANAHAQFYFGRILLERGQYEQAKEALKSACKLDPKFSKATQELLNQN